MRKPKFQSILILFLSTLSINLFAQELVTQNMTAAEAKRYEELRKAEQTFYQNLFEEEEAYYKILMKDDTTAYKNYIKARRAAQKAGRPMPLPPEGYTIPDKEGYLEEVYEVDNKSKANKPKAKQRDY